MAAVGHALSAAEQHFGFCSVRSKNTMETLLQIRLSATPFCFSNYRTILQLYPIPSHNNRWLYRAQQSVAISGTTIVNHSLASYRYPVLPQNPKKKKISPQTEFPGAMTNASFFSFFLENQQNDAESCSLWSGLSIDVTHAKFGQCRTN